MKFPSDGVDREHLCVINRSEPEPWQCSLRPLYIIFFFRNSRIAGMISLLWVSSAKCPVS
ncbi:hypothetical protein QE396_004630 [Enterobacter sp. SORGH_AS 287]|nr:hypothetical protein [Enterobacter sp. SORGH_AS_0287]